MNKTIEKAYAKLIVTSGLALKKGQSVIIKANADIEDFVCLVTKECYAQGAKYVHVLWQSEKVNKVQMKKASTKALCETLPMEVAYQQWFTKELPAYLWLDSDDPDASKGIDAAKAAKIKREKYKAVAEYIEARENKYQWCICGVPSKKWAKKVFPSLTLAKAKEKLYEAILLTSRASDGNGIFNWEKHDEILKNRCSYLNSLHLKSLHYTSSNGTNLKVGLIPNVIWLGGGEKTLDGTFFQPNIPSEEVFTSPKKGEAEGIVYSAKPLVYQGQLIKDFWVKFEKGKAVDVHAEVGEEALRSILTLDEGSAYLGECALVPFDSPINNTGLLFYNTLFDENAACHLALGRGFTTLYPHFENYSEDELHSFGINKSLSHVDFMIGSKDLNIVGETIDGKQVQIFKDGNWAF
ncbi:MAG TPA: aminopeptidase [Firmicutes bacterium]|nr:aminopeptidase [Bacillota bacterium]